MSPAATRWLAILALALLPLAATPLVGLWAAGVSGLILAVLAGALLVGFTGWRPGHRWWGVLVPGLAALGGFIGVGSAVYAVVAVGDVMPYAERVGAGYAALALAALAGAGGLLAVRRPAAGAAVIVVAGLLGAVAINLFSINTYYVLAVPLWLVAAIAALATAPAPER